MRYYIEVPEVHIAFHEVEAKNKNEAIQKVKDGDSVEVAFEYSHSLEIKNIIEEEK